ncbi:hypothetical protein M427DRAFT_137139 [Gonapodya prolifera JEL478]|uniref:Uncharacterized protein n=1 Tax=Gonapodya prolifera (strain JEL478) TaxID=1344416 RepID=A0A139A760_GONPJ|nr:hypothetical protein M427DRAFT_137139 [Gonapodya prolifera JEL478]|eukprot:KXS12617.1 hypothetical protein M427DRAFT_137139 [Gonapodya prolifera JEL478]
MFSIETAVDDHSTWRPGEAAMFLDQGIDLARNQAEVIRRGKAGISGTDSVPFLYPMLVSGGFCNNPAGCTNRTWNATIGLTSNLVLGGIEKVQRVFLENAQIFLAADPPQRTLKNDEYTLMYGISRDLTGGITNIYLPVFNLGQIVHDRAVAEVSGTFAVCVAAGVMTYLLVFRRLVRDMAGQTDELVDIVFSVPKSVIPPGSPLARCVETGGLSVEVALEEAAV